MVVIVGALLGVLMLMLFACILLFFISVQILPSPLSSVVTWLIEDRILAVAALIGSILCSIWFIPQELKKKRNRRLRDES
jgi:4-amino-4-deoxy-L-arabinose transferase-like glycosyltransferase